MLVAIVNTSVLTQVPVGPMLPPMSERTEQLQIRVTPAEKARLKALARQAGLPVSAWVLARALPGHADEVSRLLSQMVDEHARSHALAALNDLLTGLGPEAFKAALEDVDPGNLPRLWRNYVAAMVELAASRLQLPPPSWVADVEPLDEPWFATPLKSLRPYLLRASPVPFRRRNLFIDASLGDRL